MITGIGAIVFLLLVALSLGGAVVVAFSHNIVRSAFALLATFLGVAGLYATLSADFVAVTQMLVYVGGILIVILFAVMLTSRLGEVGASNPSMGLVPGIAMLVGVAVLLVTAALRTSWPGAPATHPTHTTAAIGDALLGPYVLPFEVISILLFAALLGAVTLAKSEKKTDEGTSPVNWIRK